MSGHHARVTVIVPCRDYGRFLRGALASLSSQTFVRWECIVVDDGSTDETSAVLKELTLADPRIRAVRQAPAGVSAARNAALAVATTEYVQFLDADDRLDVDKLRAHVEYLDRHPEIDVVYGDIATFTGETEPTSLEPLDLGRPSGRPDRVIESLVIRNHLAIHAPLLRRTLLAECGGFSEDLAHLEDWDFWMRCAMSGGRFAHLAAPLSLALVRVHPDSATRDHPKMLAATVELRRRFKELPLPLTAWTTNQRLLVNAELKLAVADLRRWRLRQSVAGTAHAVADGVGWRKRHGGHGRAS